MDLPWNRLGVWLVVAWFVYQLKDFFGVSNRIPMPLCDAMSIPQQRSTAHYVAFRNSVVHMRDQLHVYTVPKFDGKSCMHPKCA